MTPDARRLRVDVRVYLDPASREVRLRWDRVQMAAAIRREGLESSGEMAAVRLEPDATESSSASSS